MTRFGKLKRSTVDSGALYVRYAHYRVCKQTRGEIIGVLKGHGPLGEGVAEDRKAGWREGETSPL